MSKVLSEKVIVQQIPELGYGNENGISLDEKIESGICSEVDIEFAVKIIKSGICMRKITKVDCGCIDGRRAEEVHFVDKGGTDIVNQTEDTTIHERYKVAGGGYITGLAMLAGIDCLGLHVDDDMSKVIHNFSENSIYCGTHDGCHGHGEKSDCGANDNLKLIFENGIKHKNSIKNSIVGLLDVVGLGVEDDVLDDIFKNWNTAVENDSYFDGSCGSSRYKKMKDSINDIYLKNDEIENPVAVSKKLAGDHQEAFIIINYCEGMTFSQPTFRLKLSEEYPDKHIDCHAQAFVIDIARIEELAKSVAEQNDSDYMQTLATGIAYQLATAATLTDGSLKTFVVKMQN